MTSIFATLFYTPLYMLSIPLLSYDAYYLLKTILRSEVHQRNPMLVLFEVSIITTSLMMMKFVSCSLFLFISFTIRKIILQLGNLTLVDFPEIFNPKFATVWVLHHNVEIEKNLNEVQKGDVLVIHDGEIIALNGIVTKGSGEVEQYALNGASQICLKNHGDWVFAFSRLHSGNLHIRY